MSKRKTIEEISHIKVDVNNPNSTFEDIIQAYSAHCESNGAPKSVMEFLKKFKKLCVKAEKKDPKFTTQGLLAGFFLFCVEVESVTKKALGLIEEGKINPNEPIYAEVNDGDVTIKKKENLH